MLIAESNKKVGNDIKSNKVRNVDWIGFQQKRTFHTPYCVI